MYAKYLLLVYFNYDFDLFFLVGQSMDWKAWNSVCCACMCSTEHFVVIVSWKTITRNYVLSIFSSRCWTIILSCMLLDQTQN